MGCLIFIFQNISQVIFQCEAIGDREIKRPLNPFHHRFRHILPFINIRSAIVIFTGITGFNFIVVIVAVPGHACLHIISIMVFDANFFIHTGFSAKIIITLQVTTATAVTALTVTVQQIVRIGLIKIRRFPRTSNPHFQGKIAPQLLGEV